MTLARFQSRSESREPQVRASPAFRSPVARRDRTELQSIEAAVTGVWPDMPDGIRDRDSDVWEPLLSIADAAGGRWPHCARVAAVALVADSRRLSPSLGIRLLADLKAIFADRDSMSTEEILRARCAMDKAPWGDLRGKPMDSRYLANLLRKYSVRSKNIRVGDRITKGYELLTLVDAFERYLSAPPIDAATCATSATND